jgi:2-polyprenyl-3-methyl-5-hydroxy-6-metoxy-1,4-benzoquinol methylase
VAFRGIGLLDGEKRILMLTRKQKFEYFLNSMLATGQRVKCTYCGSVDCVEIDRKYLVTKLMECQNCHLYFRFPVDKKEVNGDYYQTEYKENDHITTELPDTLLLEKLKLENFSSVNKNANKYLDLFTRLFPSEKSLHIIDYGCSWGYLTSQFKKAGHEVQGFEISRSRAAYGVKNLDVEICPDENLLRDNNHIFFSSHVIEHHPDIPSMIRLAEKLLIQGGYFIAFCPNGSPAFRQKNQEAFHHIWGKAHPNYLNAEFFKYIFQDRPYFIASNPVNRGHIHALAEHERTVDDLSGEELLVIARFNMVDG